MSIETCTMLRSVSRRAIGDHEPLRHARTDNPVHFRGFMSLRSESAGRRNTRAASSAMAVAIARGSGKGGDLAELFARADAAGDPETPAFLPLDHHPALQDEKGVVVSLSLAQQDIARVHFQDRRAGQDVPAVLRRKPTQVRAGDGPAAPGPPAWRRGPCGLAMRPRRRRAASLDAERRP